MRRYIILFMLLWAALNINAQNIFSDTVFAKAACGFNFPEGPAWDGNNLYLSNCYSNWIAKISGDTRSINITDSTGETRIILLEENEAAAIDLIGGDDGPITLFFTERKADTLLTFPSELGEAASNGLVFSSNGYLYACDYKGGRILRIDPIKLSIEIIVSGFNGEKLNRPNDLAFSPQGILYFTDPKSYDKNNRDGSVYAYFPDSGKLLKTAEGLAFPNGIAFSNDGKNLFVCESAMERILKFPVNADGALGEMTEFVKLPGGDPDGIAFDENGNLYAAHFGGSAVYVINPMGKIIDKIFTPGKKPSNVEFGGEDMRDLYVTEDETNCVYVVRTIIPGKILFSSPMQNK